jgi:DNA-binding response OmpR family regulator
MAAEAKKILAVEDDRDILELYEYIFNEAGYEVSTSATGKDLSTLIDTFHPAVILLDVDLGELNGADLCRQLKANPATKALFVVLVSANLNIREIMLRSGADAFIAKPFDLDNLLRCTATYFTRLN